ncbi:MAG TPA: hypothetical protein VL633_08550 [Bacteroidota bacterium]|jgi:hypothetical protein|nr:hypothetical protein [Bacteroidota bacterium]
MKPNIYKTITFILAVVVILLLVILVHDHLIDPHKPIWKNFMIADTTQIDTTKIHNSLK